MTLLHRTLTYLIVLAIVLGVVFLGLPRHVYQPQGLFLAAKTGLPPLMIKQVMIEQVKLLDNNAVSGDLVGYINVQAYAPKVDEMLIKDMERYAINLAANAGANRLVVTQFGQSTSQQLLVFQARAISTVNS